jgi:hypothetical protein
VEAALQDAALQDMVRELDRFGPLMGAYVFEPEDLEVEIEIVRALDDRPELVLATALDDDDVASAWFASHDETAPVPLEEHGETVGMPATVHGLVAFGVAVALAASIHAAW